MPKLTRKLLAPGTTSHPKLSKLLSKRGHTAQHGPTMIRLIMTLVLLTLLTCGSSVSERLCDEFFYLVQYACACTYNSSPVGNPYVCSGQLCAGNGVPRSANTTGKLVTRSRSDLPPECDCPFDQDLITDLIPSMTKDWPGYGDTNADFWKHEWDKHGSCAITYEKAIGGPVTEEHDYFAKALQLHSQCNVLESFEAAGIHVGSAASSASLIGAIKHSCRVEPQIACHYGTADLQEVRICYNDQFTPIDCQQARLVEGCKGKEIVLPDWQEASATS